MSFQTFVVLLATLPSQTPDAPVAYTNAAIETAGKSGRIENATLILHAGKIQAVGTDVKAPDDARVIDARGKTIMPGILDPSREVVIAGGAADTGPRTAVVARRTTTAHARPAGPGRG